MNRRRFLAVTSPFLAGCTGASNSSETRTSGPTETEAAPSSPEPTTHSSSGEPTVRPTTTEPPVNAEEVYSFGEWVSYEYWALRIEGFDLQTEFEDVFGLSEPEGVQKMPDDEQLLIGHISWKNIGQEAYPPTSMTPFFAAIANGERYPSTGSFEHPNYDETVDIDWIAQSTKKRRVDTGTKKIPSGVVIPRWFGAIVPRSVEREDTAIGYDSDRISNGFESWWTDDGKVP